MSLECIEGRGMIQLFGTDRSDAGLAKAGINTPTNTSRSFRACKERQKTGGAITLPSPPPSLRRYRRRQCSDEEWIRQPSGAESHSRRAGRLPMTGATRGAPLPRHLRENDVLSAPNAIFQTARRRRAWRGGEVCVWGGWVVTLQARC